VQGPRIDNCPHCGCPCALDAWGNPGTAFLLRSSCEHGMCGCHQLAEAAAPALSGALPMQPAHGQFF
jgi:hypothetical protein